MQNLSAINLKKYPPCDELAHCAQAFWVAKNSDNTDALTYKILSDCGASLIFNFGGSFGLERNGEIIKSVERSVIVGPGKDLLKMTFSGPVSAVGIHFLPMAGHLFFKQDMNQLANRFMDDSQAIVNDLFQSNSSSFEKLKLLVEEAGPEEVSQYLQKMLLAVLADYKTLAQDRLMTLFYTLENNSQLGLTELSEQLGVSVRDIQRLFKQYVGVTPNVYMRLNKINQLKTKIANNEFSTLTELAIDSGYFDQAHFIRDFKLFMQETPKQYHTLKQSP
ncbi:MAG: helix-turn-helix transcriptional regulator [Bermanella sp.]